jgi:hypothetical protein
MVRSVRRRSVRRKKRYISVGGGVVLERGEGRGVDVDGQVEEGQIKWDGNTSQEVWGGGGKGMCGYELHVLMAGVYYVGCWWEKSMGGGGFPIVVKMCYACVVECVVWVSEGEKILVSWYGKSPVSYLTYIWCALCLYIMLLCDCYQIV